MIHSFFSPVESTSGESEIEDYEEHDSRKFKSNSINSDSEESADDGNDACVSDCCSAQQSLPSMEAKIANRKQGKQRRSLCGTWFRDHPWLTF